jgi:Big-like domain-containing protein/VCBS repeat protein
MRTHTQLKNFFARVLIALTTLTTLAQVTNTVQASGLPLVSSQISTASAPFLTARQRPLLPRRANAGRAPVNPLRRKRLDARAMDPGSQLFLPPVLYGSGGDTVFSVAVGDVNGDGKPDLVVTNYFPSSVAVLLGRGNGTFESAVTYGTGGLGPGSVAIADVNGDGNLDLVVANFCADKRACSLSGSGESGVGVLLGNGDGTFQTVVTYRSGGSFIQSVLVADVDGDGHPDLLVVNACAFVKAAKCSVPLLNGNVGVLLGNGLGTFQLINTFDSGGLEPTSIAVGDFDGNGTLDLVVTNVSSDTVGVLLGNGFGFFGNAVTYSASFALSVAVADVNGDGKLDLLVASTDITSNGAAVVLFGNGDGTFRPMGTYNSGGQQTTWIAVADVDGDSKSDLMVVNSGSGTVGVLLGNGNGTFQSALTFESGGSSPFSVAVADVNGDAKPDLLVTDTSSVPGTVGVLLNNTGVHNPTSTSLTSSLNPSIYGQAVTWTAMVTSSGSFTPTGKVRFTWSGNTIGSAILNTGGVATLTKSNLNADAFPLTAVYSGDANNLGSTSAVVNQVVTQTTSAASITSSPNPSTQGQAVTFTATITSPTVKPTGPVTFTAGKTVLGTAQLGSGHAKLTISSLPVGSTKVKATYNGDSNIAKSSASVTQTVR